MINLLLCRISDSHHTEKSAKRLLRRDYAQFTCRIRKHKVNMSIEEAVRLTVDECIEEGILRDFLISRKAEVIKMSIYEYDFDEHMDVIRQESYEDGFAEGEAVGEAKGRAEGEARIKAETSRKLAGRGFKASDIAEIVNTGTDEVEQWLRKQNDQILKETNSKSIRQKKL